MNRFPRLFTFLIVLCLVLSCSSGKQEAIELSTLVVRQEVEPDKLLPSLTTSGYARQVHQLIFQYLLVQDPVTFEYVPQLAKSRPVIQQHEDGTHQGMTSYAYELYEEAVWDDGKPVTGHDFAFSLKTILNPKVPAARYRPFLSFVKEIEVDPQNPKKFVVYLNSNYILGEEVLNSLTPVLPRHLYDQQGLLKGIPFGTFADEKEINVLAESGEVLQAFANQITDPAYSREPGKVSGSGPYRLREWITGQQVVLERKTSWWGDQAQPKSPGLAAYPSEIVFRIVTDNPAAVTALKAQELDVVSRVQSQSFLDLKEDEEVNKNYNFYSPIALENYFININTRSPKLRSLRVRQALAYAIHVEEIVREAQLGMAIRSVGPVHPQSPYFNTDLVPIPFEPETAKKLLLAEGWSDTDGNGIADKLVNGRRTQLDLKLLVTANSEYLGLLIQKHAKEAGINIRLEEKEFRSILEDTRNGDYELAFAGAALTATLWDPKEQYHTQAGDNRTGFGSAASDRLIDKLRLDLNEESRNASYRELQQMVYDQQPCIWLYVSKGKVVVHKKFEPVITPLFPNYEPRLFQPN